MCKSFMDMEDGDFCFTTSDNMAMDSEGHKDANVQLINQNDINKHYHLFIKNVKKTMLLTDIVNRRIMKLWRASVIKGLVDTCYGCFLYSNGGGIWI